MMHIVLLLRTVGPAEIKKSLAIIIRREGIKISRKLKSGGDQNNAIEHFIEVWHRKVLFVHYDV